MLLGVDGIILVVGHASKVGSIIPGWMIGQSCYEFGLLVETIDNIS